MIEKYECLNNLIINRAFSYSKFKNQNIESWFEKHPYFKGARVALNHYEDNKFPVQSNFFWMNKNSNLERMLKVTKLTTNWQDSELTRLPQYKVGIDFFLNSKANKLSMIITNYDNLRVINFYEKLTKKEIDFLNKTKNCIIKEKTQNKIHHILWKSLKEYLSKKGE